jgi:hypothetical protein
METKFVANRYLFELRLSIPGFDRIWYPNQRLERKEKRANRTGGATDEDSARCSLILYGVASDVSDLILHEQLEHERSNFVLKSIAQSLNSCALDDVLKFAADASVRAVNLLSDSGSYRFGSLDVRVEPLDYDCLGLCRRNLDGRFDPLAAIVLPSVSLIAVQEAARLW